jgi:hypothetical protein
MTDKIFDSAGNEISGIISKVGEVFLGNHKGERPLQPIFTKAEMEEIKRWDTWRANAVANEPYLGWPPSTPIFTHPNPLVNEMAEWLWETGLVP